MSNKNYKNIAQEVIRGIGGTEQQHYFDGSLCY